MLELSGQSGETPSSLAAKAVRMDMPRHQSLSVVCMPAQCLRRAFNAWIHHTSNRVNPLERFNQLMHARLVEHMNERCLDPMVGSGRIDHKNRESMISELEAYEQAYLDSLDVARGGRLTQASSADAPSATEATASAQPEISADLLVAMVRNNSEIQASLRFSPGLFN
jgi:hypothetical protein